MLKERLKRRRHIKDEIMKVNCFLSGSSGDFSSGKVDRQIKGFDNRRYTPRVLSELFGLDTPGAPLQHVSRIGKKEVPTMKKSSHNILLLLILGILYLPSGIIFELAKNIGNSPVRFISCV